MIIPDTLQIGPFMYTVKRGYNFRESKDLWGQQDPTCLEIRLSQHNQGMRPHETTDAETKLHEIIHAISSSCFPQSLQLSEDLVDIMAKHFLDTIRRNKIDLLNTGIDWEE